MSQCFMLYISTFWGSHSNVVYVHCKMNTILYTGLLLVAVATLSIADDPAKAATMLVVNNCKSKVGASDEDVKIVVDKKLPTTHAGMCLVECLLTRGNMMRDGKFNKQGFITAATPGMKGDADKIQKLKDMADACEKEVASAAGDQCDAAKNIVQCTSQKGKSFGFKFPSRL